MGAGGVINDLDHLSIAHPAARVEAQRDRALLGHRGIHRRFEVRDHGRILGSKQRLAGVVVWIDKRDLPDHVPDREGVGVVLDVVDEARHQVLRKAPSPGRVVLEEGTRQFPVRRREDDAHARA